MVTRRHKLINFNIDSNPLPIHKNSSSCAIYVSCTYDVIDDTNRSNFGIAITRSMSIVQCGSKHILHLSGWIFFLFLPVLCPLLFLHSLFMFFRHCLITIGPFFTTQKYFKLWTHTYPLVLPSNHIKGPIKGL